MKFQQKERTACLHCASYCVIGPEMCLARREIHEKRLGRKKNEHVASSELHNAVKFLSPVVLSGGRCAAASRHACEGAHNRSESSGILTPLVVDATIIISVESIPFSSG